MRISTKSCYKLFNVVHNYFLCIFQIIERIYDDPIPQNNFRKIAKNGKLENVNIFQVMLKTFQYGSKLRLSMYTSNHWEDIWWSYPQNNLEKLWKTWNLKMWISTKSCYKLFSVVPNYCLCIFQIIERIYGDYILQHVPKNVQYFARNRKPENASIEKTCYKLFNGAQNDSLSMFQIIEKINDDCIRPTCPQKLEKIDEKQETWKCEYLPSHVTNFSVWFKTTFYVYFKSLRGYMMILSPKIT